MPKLTPMQSRVAAVALLVVVVLVVYRAAGLPVWRTYTDNRDTIDQLRDDIARFSRMADRLSTYETALADLQKDDRLSDYILTEESETLAAARLQETVKATVRSAGGNLTSTQVLPVEVEQSFRRVTVNVRMAVTVEALQRVLYDIESALPYLMVTDVVVLARNPRARRRATSSAIALDVRLNLSGFMRPAPESG